MEKVYKNQFQRGLEGALRIIYSRFCTLGSTEPKFGMNILQALKILLYKTENHIWSLSTKKLLIRIQCSFRHYLKKLFKMLRLFTISNFKLFLTIKFRLRKLDFYKIIKLHFTSTMEQIITKSD